MKFAFASHKNIRISPQKLRLVGDLIKNYSVIEALEILTFCRKKGAIFLHKILNSALHNAVNNFQMNGDNLYIGKLLIDKGRTLKRIMPRAKGRADRIKKRTSNVYISLIDKQNRKRKK